MFVSIITYSSSYSWIHPCQWWCRWRGHLHAQSCFSEPFTLSTGKRRVMAGADWQNMKIMKQKKHEACSSCSTKYAVLQEEATHRSFRWKHCSRKLKSPDSHVLFKAMHGCAWWSFQSLNSQECCSAFVLKGGIHDWAKFCEAFDFEDPGFSGLELLGAMCSARWANGMLQLGCYGGCRNAEILAGSVVIGKAPLVLYIGAFWIQTVQSKEPEVESHGQKISDAFTIFQAQFYTCIRAFYRNHYNICWWSLNLS